MAKGLMYASGSEQGIPVSVITVGGTISWQPLKKKEKHGKSYIDRRKDTK
jgi:hypothetical protein